MEKIIELVLQEKKLFSKSRLQDYYKLIFQSRYGPGHIIEDVEKAYSYFEKELTLCNQDTEGFYFRNISTEIPLLRINLKAVLDEKMDKKSYFEAFFKTALNFEKSFVLEEWKTQWQEISRKIISIFPEDDLLEDMPRIEENLSQGNYLFHHSEIYRESYNPHYRVISPKYLSKSEKEKIGYE